MQNESNRPSDPSEKHKTENVSAFRNAWEIEAKARRAEELKERERQAKEAEAAYQAREEYAKELAEEKVDLIRLKQGVITESDKVFREAETEKHYTVWQKIGNWFYHSKWWLGIATFIAAVAGFLIYDYVTRVDPDVRILLLTEDPELYSESDQLCAWMQTMVPDYNGDEKTLVQSVYIPVSEQSMEHSGNYSAAYNSQLLVQFQTATCMLVLVAPEAESYLQPEEMFTDLEKLYPDCPYADGYKLMLDGTKFAEAAGLSEPPHKGSYLTLRLVAENMNSLEENQEAYNRAKALLDAIIPQL
ncbi:MAG: hypothetical protein IKQ91_08800 [Oscillospiraceae bacterium]|nr:hypothetical protein [Oscillospiraceae bacterium]